MRKAPRPPSCPARLAALSALFVGLATGCYPDFRFEESAEGGASQGGRGGAGQGGGKGGAGGGEGGGATLPCGELAPGTGDHRTTCAPGQSCCFVIEDASGESDFCAERGACGDGSREYACRSSTDCVRGTCCSAVEVSESSLRLTGSSCKDGCDSGEAELCDPEAPDTCDFGVPCRTAFGAYGACIPETSSSSSSSSSSAGAGGTTPS